MSYFTYCYIADTAVMEIKRIAFGLSLALARGYQAGDRDSSHRFQPLVIQIPASHQELLRSRKDDDTPSEWLP